MSNTEKYRGLCSIIGYYAMDLGYGCASSPKGGTVYLFFGDPDSNSFKEDFESLFEECELMDWHTIWFRRCREDKRLHDQIGRINYPCAHVFHLWKKSDMEKLKRIKTYIVRLCQ